MTSLGREESMSACRCLSYSPILLNPARISPETMRSRVRDPAQARSTPSPRRCELSPTPPAAAFAPLERPPDVMMKGTLANPRAFSSMATSCGSSPATSEGEKKDIWLKSAVLALFREQNLENRVENRRKARSPALGDVEGGR